MIESITGGYTASGRVTGNALILTLPDAIAPVVWRFDLSQVRSSALEVRETDGKFVLVIKTPRSDTHDVAVFADRAGAVRALMAASRALEGQPDYTAGPDAPPAAANDAVLTARRDEPARYAPREKRGGAGKWVAGILGVLVLLVVLIALRSQMPSNASFDTSATGGGTPVPGAAADAAGSSGVPVSADQFLMQNNTKAAQ